MKVSESSPLPAFFLQSLKFQSRIKIKAKKENGKKLSNPKVI